MKKIVVVPALLALTVLTGVALSGCDGKAAPLTADEKKNFEGHPPANQGEAIRKVQEDYRAKHPDEFKGGAQSGPGVAPPNAIPSGPPPGGGAPR